MKTKLHIVIIVTLSLVWLILSADGDVAFAAWEPPIGIPEPSFGIEETHLMYEGQTYDFGSGPEPYKDAGNGPYTHYIDNTHPNATDTDPYGTVSIPRLTVPRNLPAGSVVEIHNSANPGYFGTAQIDGVGTAKRPIFVRGIDMPRLDFGLEIGFYGNARYIIVEGISFFGGSILARADGTVFDTSYIAVRNCDFYGDENGGGFGITSWTSNSVNNIVFYDNKVHDNGIWDPDLATGDRDIGGIGVGRASDIWIVDNEMYHNECDGIQISAGNVEPSYLTHHIYVGRNIAHHNKQNGFWVKNAQDVIFSENIAYGHRPSSSANGGGMGYQYDPQRVWYIFNHLYNNDRGFVTGSSNIGTREDMHIIGNVIHDGEIGIEINSRGVDSEMIIGNTIYNVSTGINNGYYTASLQMHNNIIAGVSGDHILFPASYATGANSDISYTLFDSPVRINWGGSIYNSVASFQSGEGEGLGCIKADPQFIDAANGDFHLQPTSPVIDNGTLSDVYQIFFDLYGIDIRKDIEGNSRPQGSGWDIGAYEYVAFSPSPNQPPIANAGPNQTITDKDKDGSEEVTLDGSASRDPDGTIVSFIWSEEGSQIATGMNPTVTISTGTHLITVTVTDNGGLTDTDTVTIKVLEGDKGFRELPAGCYNNVFNPAKGEKALIVVELTKQGHVRLNLYNTRGNKIRELANEQKEAGTHKYYWDGKSGNGDVVGSGLYFVHIQAGDYKKTKKIVVVK